MSLSHNVNVIHSQLQIWNIEDAIYSTSRHLVLPHKDEVDEVFFVWHVL